ncbi:MAG TPA: AAA family ATPase [Pseudonocardiaceae bacterium]|jgi:DNA-binding CsgD family transcriptional regulator|nr:AAA family ATPase [Pseudonocardiaceae bacterium]
MASVPGPRPAPVSDPGAVVRGRDRLLSAIDQLLADTRDRRGGALCVLGGAGLGKTTVLRAAGRAATGFHLLSTSGVEPESMLPMSGLHRLLQPLSRQLDDFSATQHAALAELLGPGRSPTTADFVLCSALHRLFVDVSVARPVLCCVDDAHWLDPVSLAALAFVARRVSTERVALIFAGDRRSDRDLVADPLAGIPRARLAPLDDEASRQLLGDRMVGWLAPDLAADIVFDVVEVASGNPLALVELTAALSNEKLGGEALVPSCLPPHSRLRRAVGRRFGQLSEPARRVILMAVVDEQLAVDTVLRAAEDGTDLGALDEAIASGLVAVENTVLAVPTRLIRAILHAEASLAERHAAHRALAALLDAGRDRLRWTWHRAVTDASGRERLAGELRDGATVARLGGHYAESSAAFERAAALVRQPGAQATLLLDAARDRWLAGGTRRARALLRQAAPLSATAGSRGVVDLMHGAIALRDGAPAAAGQNLRAAAEQLLDDDRPTALTALVLAGEASCLVGDYAGYFDTGSRVAELRGPDETPVDQLVFDHFAGMSAMYSARHEQSLEPLRNVLRLADSVHEVTPLILASQAAYALGDLTRCHELAVRSVRLARETSLVTLVPWALIYVSMSALLLDQHAAAVSAALEGLQEAQAIGQRNCAADHLTILAMLAAVQGDRETALHRVDAAAGWIAAQGLARAATLSSWALACVDLADDRPTDAMDRLRLMAAGAGGVHLAIRVMAAPHVVEAGTRSQQLVPALHALRTFDRWVGDSDCGPRLALSHRCHAMLADEVGEADEHFREAIRQHRRSETALELAKTELFYAAKLRRGRKPTAARELLRDAVKIFHDYHAEPWARRATAELRAAGESVRGGGSGPMAELTAQQLEISRLVAEGATNREIAAQLDISARTVDHHLRNIFARLGVRSRVELAARFH